MNFEDRINEAISDLKLPPDGVYFVYRLGDGEEMMVRRNHGGKPGYYGATNDWDFSASNDNDLRAKLHGWGAKYVGVEKFAAGRP